MGALVNCIRDKGTILAVTHDCQNICNIMILTSKWI